MIFSCHRTTHTQLIPNRRIQFTAGCVVGRNNQSPFRGFRISASNSPDALFPTGNFLDASLLPELDDRGRALASGQHFDGGFERRVFLTYDLIQLCSSHSGLLQLLEWTASLDTLMLSCIADQEHAIIRTET